MSGIPDGLGRKGAAGYYCGGKRFSLFRNFKNWESADD